MGFDVLRDRFLRLRDDDITPEEADRTIQRLGAQAARLYRDYAAAGVKGFDLEFGQPKLKQGDVLGNERLWSHTWLMITTMLAGRYPGHLPEAFGDGATVVVGDIVYSTTFPPERWRQRCEDHAAACALLSELAHEREPHAASPSSEARHLSGFDKPVKTADAAKVLNIRADSLLNRLRRAHCKTSPKGTRPAYAEYDDICKLFPGYRKHRTN